MTTALAALAGPCRPATTNVFAHSTDADHSETLADTFAAHLDGCGVVLSRA